MGDQLNIGVRFGGNIDELRAASSGAAAALTGIKNAAGGLAPSLTQIGPASAKASAGIEGLAQDARSAKGAIDDIGGRNVITAFERIRTEAVKTGQAVKDGLNISTGAVNVQAPINSLNKLRDAVTRLKADLRTGVPVQFTQSFNNIPKAAEQASNGLKKIPVGANQAGLALTNLGRVAQDAPFGFIGIQNNINPLLESFQRLKQETGSTGSALRALGSSLAGAAGIGLAISVVSSLVTAAVQKYGSLGAALDALTSNYSTAEQAQRDLNKVVEEAAGTAAGEVAFVNALLETGRNDQLSKEARTQAINKLNKEYDEFLPKLTLENINTQSVTDSVNKLTASLIRQAKIRGAQELISKETQKQAELFGKLVDEIENGDKGFRGFLNTLKGGPQLLGTGISGASVEVFKLNKALDNTEGRLTKFNSFLKTLTAEEATAGTLDGDGEKEKKKSKKIVDALELRIQALRKLRTEVGLTNQQQIELVQLEANLIQRDGIKLGFTKQEVQDQIDALINNTFGDGKEFVTSRLKVRIAGDLDTTKVKTDIPKFKVSTEIDPVLDAVKFNNSLTEEGKKLSAQVKDSFIINVPAALNVEQIDPNFADPLVQQIKDGGERAKAEAEKVALDIGDVFERFLEQAAANLGEGFGNVISGVGNVEDIVKGFATLVGDVIVQLGKYAIQAGIIVGALKKAMAKLAAKPVLAVAAGIAAVAIGTALKNKFSNQKIPGFADGVINFSGGLAVVGERGPELVNLPRGSDVIPNNFLQGQQPVFLQPSIDFSGDQFRFMLNKVDARKRRI